MLPAWVAQFQRKDAEMVKQYRLKDLLLLIVIMPTLTVAGIIFLPMVGFTWLNVSAVLLSWILIWGCGKWYTNFRVPSRPYFPEELEQLKKYEQLREESIKKGWKGWEYGRVVDQERQKDAVKFREGRTLLDGERSMIWNLIKDWETFFPDYQVPNLKISEVTFVGEPLSCLGHHRPQTVYFVNHSAFLTYPNIEEVAERYYVEYTESRKIHLVNEDGACVTNGIVLGGEIFLFLETEHQLPTDLCTYLRSGHGNMIPMKQTAPDQD